MHVDDTTRLQHVRDAAAAALRFIKGRERGDLDEDEMLMFSVVRALEIIGEAASKITEPTRAAYPDVPWQRIVGMRNWLAHAYFRVDPDLVWNTVTQELPALIDALKHRRPLNG